MQNNDLPSSFELDQNKAAKLVGAYKAGVDWDQEYKGEVAKISKEYDAKLTDARIAGYSNRRIDSINNKRQRELDDSPKLKKFKSLAETTPKPTAEQKNMAMAALDELVALCDEFVTQVVREHIELTQSTADYNDVLNAGRTGLIQSLPNYNPEKGPLSEYAIPFIKRAIADYIDESVGSAVYYQSMVAKYGAAVKKLISEGNTSPNLADIAGEMEIGLEALQKLINVMNRGDKFRPDGESPPITA